LPKSIVSKRFRDKHTNKIHDVGTEYEGSKGRIDELTELGYLEKNSEPSVLGGNAQEAIAGITAENSKEELEALLVKEKEGKNRKTVIEHIESLLN
jgi:hypothetical protein